MCKTWGFRYSRLAIYPATPGINMYKQGGLSKPPYKHAATILRMSGSAFPSLMILSTLFSHNQSPTSLMRSILLAIIALAFCSPSFASASIHMVQTHFPETQKWILISVLSLLSTMMSQKSLDLLNRAHYDNLDSDNLDLDDQAAIMEIGCKLQELAN